MWVGLRIREDCLPECWHQPTSTTAHNSHQICVRVVPPEDVQVMPETFRDFEPQWSVSESEVYQVGCVYYVITYKTGSEEVDPVLIMHSPLNKQQRKEGNLT
jgi:hypothetical protein